MQHGGPRDAPVERHEPRTMRNRQRKQIDVGQLPVPLDVLMSYKLCVEQRDIVGQEHMSGSGYGLRQFLDGLVDADGIGIRLLSNDPQIPVLRDRTGRPRIRVLIPPSHDGCMVLMVGVEQADQDAYVEQTCHLDP